MSENDLSRADDPIVTPPTDKEPIFLQLPLEIRYKIYHCLLPYNTTRTFQTQSKDRGSLNFGSRGEGDEFLVDELLATKAHPEIMRVNKQVHSEVQSFFFKGSTIIIHIDETGYSFLEKEAAGFYFDPEARKRYQKHRRDKQMDCFVHHAHNRWSNHGKYKGPLAMIFRPGDRITEWHKAFVSRFNFTLLKKLIINIEAAPYANPKHILRISRAVRQLCEMLRTHPRMPEIEIVPLSQKYRFAFQEDRLNVWDVRASYFVWVWESEAAGSIPPFQTNGPQRYDSKDWRILRQDQVVVWKGELSHHLHEKISDLVVVLSPFRLLRHVPQASITLPPGPPRLNREYCTRCMEGRHQSRTVEEEIVFLDEREADHRQNLETPETKRRIRVAKRLEAKDRFFEYTGESSDGGFTTSGEVGFNSDDSDW